jgi:hypothetical protein
VLLQQLPRHVDADNTGARNDKVKSLHHEVHLPLTSAAFPEVGARGRMSAAVLIEQRNQHAGNLFCEWVDIVMALTALAGMPS